MKKHRALGSEKLVFLFPSSSDIFLFVWNTRLPFATTVGADQSRACDEKNMQQKNMQHATHQTMTRIDMDRASRFTFTNGIKHKYECETGLSQPDAR